MARFFRRGYSKILFGLECSTEGDSYAPSASDIDAATDLSDDVSEVNGFELTNAPIPTPNLGNQFTPQIEGEDTVADSSLVFYDDDEDEDIRSALAKGTAGFIFLAPYGLEAGKRIEVWPATSNGYNDAWSVGNEAATASAVFSITDVPEQNAEVPTTGGGGGVEG